MSLNQAFNYHKTHNRDGYETQKVNDNVLMTRFRCAGVVQQTAYYDFLSRTVSILVRGSAQDRTMVFAEMDRDVLALHREQLIALDGNPQPLPARPEDAATQKQLMAKPAFTSPKS